MPFTLKIHFFVFVYCLLIFSCKKQKKEPLKSSYNSEKILSWDLSYQPFLKAKQIDFKDSNGKIINVLTFAKQQGINVIRLRLWNNPVGKHSALTELKTYIKQIHDAGLLVWLDYHFSDTWADPGSQYIPNIWKNTTQETLIDSVNVYVLNSLKYLNLQSTDYVQLGNETNGGFMWPLANTNTSKGLKTYILCLKAGIQAVKKFNINIKTIVHISGSTDMGYHYQLLTTNKVNFDILGLSYYPNWHGTDINNKIQEIASFASSITKPVLIAETAFPFTDSFYDWTNNIIWHKNVGTEFAATPLGQKNYIQFILQTIKNNKNLIGLSYWAPDYVGFNGLKSTNGSFWENVCLWDFNYKALPAAYGWDK